MQNQNPYERLYINPTNQAQIVPQVSIQQGQPQANFADQEQPNQLQQVIIYQLQPIIAQVPPVIENPNLIQYQSRLVQKKFSIGATLINWVQEITMCTASFYVIAYDTRNVQDYIDDEGNQITPYYEYSPYYLFTLMAITLTCIICSKFKQPPKNSALQISIQVAMTILYTLLAAGITYFTYPDNIYYSCMLVTHCLTYLAILVGLVSKTGHSLRKKFAIYDLLIILIVFFLSGATILSTGDIYATLIIFFLAIFALIIYCWSLFFGMLYIYSLGKVLLGQCNLEKTASISAATIIYGSLICFC